MVGALAAKKMIAEEILVLASTELGARREKLIAEFSVKTGFTHKKISDIVDNMLTAGMIKTDGTRLFKDAPAPAARK